MAGLNRDHGVVPLAPGRCLLEWASAAMPAAGQTASGDKHLVLPSADRALVAVIDALGHGPEAAGVAAVAVETLRSAEPAGVVQRLHGCHGALAGSRGAVGAVATVDPLGTLRWAGVGNVEAVVVRRNGARAEVAASLVPARGILGMRFRPIREAVVELNPGDVLLMATDGVDVRFVGDLRPDDDPVTATGRILRARSIDADDSLILAARYVVA